MRIDAGFGTSERRQVAGLYWQAFGAKLGRVMGPDARAIGFFETSLNPDFALVARAKGGRMLGLAGFKTKEGGLIEGSFGRMAQAYGRFGAAWRGMILSVLERKLQPGVFQMDGIFVDQAARGMGVGSALLQAVVAGASKRGLHKVQLDVIDTNPRARALYQRVGFRAVNTEYTGVFARVFGFESATRMELDVSMARPGKNPHLPL
ncbi:MAG: GNAT family N-acetyltransferase [Rhodobacteraceae bacterium]|nr:GNAT family N-acetyltransferase [Paracoccaceae bacterium]